MVTGWIAGHSFGLDRAFIDIKRPIVMSPLASVIYAHHYRGHGETWATTVQRIVEGTFSILQNHCHTYNRSWDPSRAQRTAQRMYTAIYNMQFLPPGRGIRYMGTDALLRDGGARLNNCAFVSTRDIGATEWKPFTFAMDMLMCGVGVGFDISGAGQLTIHGPYDKHADDFIVEDTRQGWVKALAFLLDAYINGSHGEPIFNYVHIRPAGSRLKVSGGISSGPKPLADMLEAVRDLLKKRVGTTLRDIDILDIMTLIGRCVVSGNIRRSAMIALAEPSSNAIINGKNPSTYPERNHYVTGWSGMSNNSIIAAVGQSYPEVYNGIIRNGEPGLLWLENARRYGRMKDGPNDRDYRIRGTNPCSEQSLESYELCCLVETFPAKHATLTEYIDTVKLAYLYAKAVTLVPTHWDDTNVVMRRNRRIGCSQSGIANALAFHGPAELFKWCDTAYQFIKGLDAQYSDWLDVEPSVKMTSIKPSGTVSLLAGETPGIHFPHSEYYIRRVQLSSNDPLAAHLAEAGYHVEPYTNSPDMTLVAEFPVWERTAVRFKHDVSMYEQLALAAAYQYWWADNQVSITVTFTNHEQSRIGDAIETYAPMLKTASFLKLDTEYYQQMPYETITDGEYYAKANRLTPLKLTEDSDEMRSNEYCDSDSCGLT